MEGCRTQDTICNLEVFPLVAKSDIQYSYISSTTFLTLEVSASSSWQAWLHSTAASWPAAGRHGGLRLFEDICRISQRLHNNLKEFTHIPGCFRMFQASHQPYLRCHGLPVFEFRFVKPLLFPGKQRNGQAIGPQRGQLRLAYASHCFNRLHLV